MFFPPEKGALAQLQLSSSSAPAQLQLSSSSAPEKVTHSLRGKEHSGFLKLFKIIFVVLFFSFLLFYFFEKFDFQRMFFPLRHVGHFLR